MLTNMLSSGHELMTVTADNTETDVERVNGRLFYIPSLEDVISEIRKTGVNRAVVFSIIVVTNDDRLRGGKYTAVFVKCCDNPDCPYCSKIKGIQFYFMKNTEAEKYGG